jgi:hypothetical protein
MIRPLSRLQLMAAGDMMNKQLEQDLQRMRDWAQTLVNQIDSARPLIKDILEGKTSLPEGGHSKESLASMQFGQVHQALEEVEAAYKDVRRHF